jgi:hypothetical protein
MKAKFELKVTKWDESKPDGFNEAIPITKVSTCFEIIGNTGGKFAVEYVMVSTEYDKNDKHNSRAEYLGLMEFSGILDGKKGTFVIEDQGIYENSMPKSRLRIKENTGTGELKGINGTGEYYMANEKFLIEFEYFIENDLTKEAVAKL